MTRGMLQAAARLLIVQASINHARLQGLGIAVASEPLVRDVDGDADGGGHRAVIGRAAGFFNTHPYLAGLAVGALARAEHDRVPAEQIERLRGALKGPLGALGDRLVWGGVLPACAALGLIVTATWGPGPAVVVFLVLYNAVHLSLRWWGLRAGWRTGVRVAEALKTVALQRAARAAEPAAALAVGAAVPIVAWWLAQILSGAARWGSAGVAVVTAALVVWIAPAMGASRLGLVALGLTLLLGWL